MVRLHCQTRFDRHPRRQCNVYSPNLQRDNGGGSRHTCSLLDCFGKQSHMFSIGLLWEVTVRPHMPSSSLLCRAFREWTCVFRCLHARCRRVDWKATGILQGCIFIYSHLVTAKWGSAISEQGLTQDSRINGLATKSEKWNGNSAD